MNLLELSHIRKNYQQYCAVNDVSLAIEKGKITALVGPSGAGKSTLLQIAAGLVDPDQGAVTYNEPHVRISMVFQSYALFNNTKVKDNITYGMAKLGYSKTQIAEMLKQTAQEFRIEHLMEKKAGTLSGGEAQRVSLARAVIRKPDLLLLDEPFSALDFELRKQLLQEIRRIHDKMGVTIILVSHDYHDVLELADSIAIVDHGKVVDFNTPDQIYAHPSHIQCAKYLYADRMSFFECVPADGKISIGGFALDCKNADCVVVGVQCSDTDCNGIEITCIAVEAFYEGDHYLTVFRSEYGLLTAYTKQKYSMGDAIVLFINSDHIFVFDQSNGFLIAQSVL